MKMLVTKVEMTDMDSTGVLIIDDNKTTRDMLRTLLEFDGHKVSCCESGKSGLDLMKTMRFEIIITDYLMPEMSGDEVTRLARRFSPDSFIIGCSIDDRARQFVDAGANAFLSKDQIIHQLTPLIEQRALRQETMYAHAFGTDSREVPLTYAARGMFDKGSRVMKKNKIFMEKHDIMVSLDKKEGPPKSRIIPGGPWFGKQGAASSGIEESSMLIQKRAKRPFGQILVDGGFMSPSDLGRALDEQKHTNELLGQVLVRMGVLDPADINAVLAVQEHLDDTDEAVKTAAGVRQMLGALLLQAGHITEAELGQALDEQKKTGDKLGEIFVRQGMLTKQQLNRLLDFQNNQQSSKPVPSPLRLGEILVSAGHITREQLDSALLKQAFNRKKLGEVLIEEGFVQPHHIKHGIRLQQMLMTSVLVAVMSLGSLTACGSGGGKTGSAATVPTNSNASTTVVVPPNANQTQTTTDSFTVTYDEYGLTKPNFFYSTNNDSFWSIQADIAENVWDPNFKTVMRIDIGKTNGTAPSIGGKTFSLEESAQHEKFPGSFIILNGEKSSLKKVESGTITFTQDSTLSGDIDGTFDVMLTDYDSTISPTPHYHLMGTFSFKMGTLRAVAS